MPNFGRVIFKHLKPIDNLGPALCSFCRSPAEPMPTIAQMPFISLTSPVTPIAPMISP